LDFGLRHSDFEEIALDSDQRPAALPLRAHLFAGSEGKTTDQQRQVTSEWKSDKEAKHVPTPEHSTGSKDRRAQSND
jgi:hypothetical protein